MTKTIKQLLLSAKIALNSALEARMLLQYLLNLSYEEILLNDSRIISEQESTMLEQLIQRRLAKEPIAYIIGFKEFYGLDFHVTPDTLIPRPDSETLIEAVLENYGKDFNGQILDLGTGSGCLIITLLKHLPHAKGIALDISNKAIEVATKNAMRHNVLDRLSLINASWNNFAFDTKYDVLISNPPYIDTKEIETLENNVKNFEPLTALDGGEDGLLCYKEIFDISKKILKPDSKIFVEIGYNQEEQIKNLAIKKGLVISKTYQDLNNVARCIKFFIMY